jgi:hypothetical protein
MERSDEMVNNLDRAALWLVFGEFCGAALIVVLMALMLVGNLISPNAFDMGYGAGGIIAAGVAFVYGLAYLGNLGIGVVGLYAYIMERREGYPGTGHLLNWMFLSATIVMVLFLLIAYSASM